MLFISYLLQLIHLVIPVDFSNLLRLIFVFIDIYLKLLFSYLSN